MDPSRLLMGELRRTRRLLPLQSRIRRPLPPERAVRTDVVEGHGNLDIEHGNDFDNAPDTLASCCVSMLRLRTEALRLLRLLLVLFVHFQVFMVVMVLHNLIRRRVQGQFMMLHFYRKFLNQARMFMLIVG